MSADAVVETVRGVGIGGLTAFVAWLGIRQTGHKNKTDTAQTMFDQLQEERDAAERRHAADKLEWKEELRELKNELSRVNLDMRAAYLREIRRDDFIQDLRNHIRLGKGPPPPDWPEELRRG